MNLNIHPIFVHFPVALLTLYSLFELVRFRKLLASSEWFYIKATFVLLGTLAGYVAYETGSIAKHLIPGSRTNTLIMMHELWAQIMLIIFSLLAAAYLIEFINRLNFNWHRRRDFFGKFWKLLLKLKHFLIETQLVVPLAMIGLVSVFITGALGGAIVYGPTVDPVVSFIYHLFFGQ